MAFRRSLTRWFLGRSQASPAPAARRTACKLAAPSGAGGLLRRPFPAPSEAVREEVRERLREINGERWRFDGVVRPDAVARVSEDCERVVTAARAAAARRRLQAVTRGCVAYEEFVDIVGGSSEVAEMLESSGDVLAVGDLVFLHPDQVIWVFRLIRSSNRFHICNFFFSLLMPDLDHMMLVKSLLKTLMNLQTTYTSTNQARIWIKQMVCFFLIVLFYCFLSSFFSSHLIGISLCFFFFSLTGESFVL